MKVLVVVDMQKDFIDGALGTPEAVGIVPRVIQKIREFDGLVIATRDTHEEDYLDTQEGDTGFCGCFLLRRSDAGEP